MAYRWATAHDWLYEAIRANRVTSEDLWELVKSVDGDAIQDLFQSQMSEDKYFDPILENHEAWIVVMEPQERQAYGDSDVFWSNDSGWSDLEDATRFSKDETKTFHLPKGGEWVKYTEAEEIESALLQDEESENWWQEEDNFPGEEDSMFDHPLGDA